MEKRKTASLKREAERKGTLRGKVALTLSIVSLVVSVASLILRVLL